MTTATLSGTALVAAQKQFEQALPAIDTTLQFQFKDLPRQQREEALADARAATWSWWTSLLARGKDPLAIGVTGIASNAARFVRGGRKIGNQNFGRGCPDLQDPRVRRKTGLRVVSIEDTGAWREWLQDHRIGPADAACFSIDFEVWLASLPLRKKRMAELLLQGHRTGDVAGMVGVTAGAVSQTRSSLESSWRAYQGEVTSGEGEASCRPVGRPRKAEHGAPRRQRERIATQVLEQVS